ncbi:hypothetical protein VTK56DRAFT_4265 [Thermocarpiscus australiensis]
MRGLMQVLRSSHGPAPIFHLGSASSALPARKRYTRLSTLSWRLRSGQKTTRLQQCNHGLLVSVASAGLMLGQSHGPMHTNTIRAPASLGWCPGKLANHVTRSGDPSVHAMWARQRSALCRSGCVIQRCLVPVPVCVHGISDPFHVRRKSRPGECPTSS